MDKSVVRNISIDDIATGKVRLPFTSRAAWRTTQAECPDLRRVHAHLTQGTRPSKKDTNIHDVKWYISVATIANDGLLVIHKSDPLAESRDLIIVPRAVLSGLITALHIKLDHPSQYQMKSVMRRYFYALDIDKAVEACSEECHTYQSLKKVPKQSVPQSTTDPPECIGTPYSADIIRRERQCILTLGKM